MLARYGIVPRAEIVREVILNGTPSQVRNLPAFNRWLVVRAFAWRRFERLRIQSGLLSLMRRASSTSGSGGRI
jgi:hypothetical protein